MTITYAELAAGLAFSALLWVLITAVLAARRAAPSKAPVERLPAPAPSPSLELPPPVLPKLEPTRAQRKAKGRFQPVELRGVKEKKGSPIEIHSSRQPSGLWEARAYVRTPGTERMNLLGQVTGPTEASARRRCRRKVDALVKAMVARACADKARHACRGA